MNMEAIIADAIEYISCVFSGDCTGHDADHSLRVFDNAVKIVETEPACNRDVVMLSALLHDVDDHKLFDTSNNQNARSFLEKHHVDSETIEQICKVINGVSFSKNKGVTPDTIEGMIVQDADHLDAMGAIGIARTFAYGGNHGRTISDSLKHFDEKLLRLKDLMNTDEGRRMAISRHEYLESFLKELQEELITVEEAL